MLANFLIFLTVNDRSGKANKLGRAVYNILGIICIIFAGIGVVLPLMPTTVFVLLAAYFFTRGSERLSDWLENRSFFGKYLKNYREGRGMTSGTKIFSVLFLWAGILASVFALESIWLKVFLIIIAVSVTLHLAMIKTYREFD